jgi:hypothetical protein
MKQLLVRNVPDHVRKWIDRVPRNNETSNHLHFTFVDLPPGIYGSRV